LHSSGGDGWLSAVPVAIRCADQATAAASIASAHGVEVVATTRRRSKVAALRAAGAGQGLIDDGGPLAGDRFDGVLDLVGAHTAVDSLRLVRRGGTVCVSGSLSGWLTPDFEPIAMIPSGTRLTSFHSDDAKGGAATLQRIVGEVEAGAYRPNVDRVFDLADIVAAHQYMEDDAAAGKVVVSTR